MNVRDTLSVLESVGNSQAISRPGAAQSALQLDLQLSGIQESPGCGFLVSLLAGASGNDSRSSIGGRDD